MSDQHVLRPCRALEHRCTSLRLARFRRMRSLRALSSGARRRAAVGGCPSSWRARAVGISRDSAHSRALEWALPGKVPLQVSQPTSPQAGSNRHAGAGCVDEALSPCEDWAHRCRLHAPELRQIVNTNTRTTGAVMWSRIITQSATGSRLSASASSTSDGGNVDQCSGTGNAGQRLHLRPV